MADIPCVKITWVIKNYIHLSKDPFIDSAEFYIDFLNKSTWVLRVYPFGLSDDGFMKVQLLCKDYKGTRESKVRYDISFLSKNNNEIFAFKEPKYVLMHKNILLEMRQCPLWDEVLNTKRNIFLADGNLTLDCRLFELKSDKLNYKMFKACSDVFVNNYVFHWPAANAVPITHTEEIEECNLSFKFTLKEDIETYTVIINLNSDISYLYLECCLTVLTTDGESITFYEDLTFYSKEDSIFFSPFRRFYKTVNGKNVGDIIFDLVFDMKLSTGGYRSYTESTVSIPPHIQKAINSPSSRELTLENETIHSNCELSNDFLALLQDQTLSDFTLRSENKTFPVHKTVLAARSPVFKAMFSTDMAEANSDGVLDIADVDALTLNQLLVFAYSAVLPDESRCEMTKLYYAADKYQMLTLRGKCSVHLRENLTTGSICEVLELADRHQDEELRNAAQEFILEKKFVLSREWKEFVKRNPMLAAETMQVVCSKMMVPSQSNSLDNPS